MPVLLQLRITGENHTSFKSALTLSGPLNLAIAFSSDQKRLFHTCTSSPIFSNVCSPWVWEDDIAAHYVEKVEAVTQ